MSNNRYSPSDFSAPVPCMLHWNLTKFPASLVTVQPVMCALPVQPLLPLVTSTPPSALSVMVHLPKILDEVNPYTVSYLLNAIYFKADWASKFDSKNTKEETFTTETGSTTLPMMHQYVLISYLKTNTYSAVILPYGNSLWNMTVMLPEEGATIDDLIKQVTLSRLPNNPGWMCGTGGYFYQGYEVDLKLPRFETSSDTDELGLVELMKKMGIKQAFDSDFAEIPNMCEDRNLYISMMRQKAKIKVNEEGSEAAAVTVAGVNATTAVSPQEYPKATFHANRPFVYVISEASSGVILFVGKFTGI